MSRNSRVREQFQLALDGRQIAAVVVVALAVVAAAFGLGVNVGKHLSAAQAAAARSGDLAALDATGAVGQQARPNARDVTFITELDKQKVVAPPPVERKPVPGPAAPPAAHEPAPAPAAVTAPAAPAAPSAAPAPAEVAEPLPLPLPTAEPSVAARTVPAAATARGTWSVQLASVQARAEADRLVEKYRRLSPWVEVADIPGKGRYYRVRTGRFDTREDADRYRQEVARDTGVKGFVTGAP